MAIRHQYGATAGIIGAYGAGQAERRRAERDYARHVLLQQQRHAQRMQELGYMASIRAGRRGAPSAGTIGGRWVDPLAAGGAGAMADATGGVLPGAAEPYSLSPTASAWGPMSPAAGGTAGYAPQPAEATRAPHPGTSYHYAGGILPSPTGPPDLSAPGSAWFADEAAAAGSTPRESPDVVANRQARAEELERRRRNVQNRRMGITPGVAGGGSAGVLPGAIPGAPGVASAYSTPPLTPGMPSYSTAMPGGGYAAPATPAAAREQELAQRRLRVQQQAQIRQYERTGVRGDLVPYYEPAPSLEQQRFDLQRQRFGLDIARFQQGILESKRRQEYSAEQDRLKRADSLYRPYIDDTRSEFDEIAGAAGGGAYFTDEYRLTYQKGKQRLDAILANPDENLDAQDLWDAIRLSPEIQKALEFNEQRHTIPLEKRPGEEYPEGAFIYKNSEDPTQPRRAIGVVSEAAGLAEMRRRGFYGTGYWDFSTGEGKIVEYEPQGKLRERAKDAFEHLEEQRKAEYDKALNQWMSDAQDAREKGLPVPQKPVLQEVTTDDINRRLRQLDDVVQNYEQSQQPPAEGESIFGTPLPPAASQPAPPAAAPPPPPEATPQGGGFTADRARESLANAWEVAKEIAATPPLREEDGRMYQTAPLPPRPEETVPQQTTQPDMLKLQEMGEMLAPTAEKMPAKKAEMVDGKVYVQAGKDGTYYIVRWDASTETSEVIGIAPENMAPSPRARTSSTPFTQRRFTGGM